MRKLPWNISPEESLAITAVAITTGSLKAGRESGRRVRENVERQEAAAKLPQSLNSLCACGSGKKFKRCCIRNHK